MAIYHCSIKIISRGKGKSAVAAAAYRAGEKITNEYDGKLYDYTRKGGVVHTEILLPEHAPAEYSDRDVLWNAVEKIEKAKNSQLAREIELALPAELTREQNISLVRDYVQRNFVAAGMCADVCVHDKGDGNPHAHVMLTMRPFEPDGTWGAKSKKEYVLDEYGTRVRLKNGEFKTYKISAVDWNEQTKAEGWRAAWAESVNKVLEQRGHEARVDHRSYERQGIEQIPTVHMSVAASQMEQKGIATECGDMNREIARTNNVLFGILAKAKQLADWLKEALVPAAPLTLVRILHDTLEGGGQQKQYPIRDLKAAARVYAFMQDKGIFTMSELRDTVSEMHKPLDNARENLQWIEGRMKTLDEHISQGALYLKHKDLYAEYKALKPRKQEKFYEAHRADLMIFEAAGRYFKEHYIRPGFSVDDWKAERVELLACRGKAYREYNALKDKIWKADFVRSDAENIVREINRPQQRDSRSKGMER